MGARPPRYSKAPAASFWCRLELIDPVGGGALPDCDSRRRQGWGVLPPDPPSPVSWIGRNDYPRYPPLSERRMQSIYSCIVFFFFVDAGYAPICWPCWWLLAAHGCFTPWHALSTMFFFFGAWTTRG